MSFWQQLNQLLSESPGNLVYHLVTLFAIQATLAIAYSQWRRAQARGEEDRLARRLALAAAGMLLARVILLLLSLILAQNGDRLQALRWLPPLEQAINTVTALLVVWAVAPPLPQLPHLTDAALLLILLLLGVMYAFFAQDWAMSAEPGMIYNSSAQATLWGIFQLVILGAGALYLLYRRLPGSGLRFFPVLVLLLAHFVQFYDYPESVPSETEVTFWIRLGQLVALPLLAVLAYRHTMSGLLAAQLQSRPASEQLSEALRLATRIIDSPTLPRTLDEAVRITLEVIDTSFAGLAISQPANPDHLRVVSMQQDDDAPQHWSLNLDEWPAFRMALEQEQVVELLPQGLGARQLHDLYQEMGVRQHGALLVAPLQANANMLGVLLLGRHAPEPWPVDQHPLIGRLAAYLSRALYNAQAYERALEDVAPLTPASEALISGRIIAVEAERDRALEETAALQDKLQQAEARLFEAEGRSQRLAATIEELERKPADTDQIQVLETEIAALRESLIEAEEAMAMAAAGEGELSTEWVMMTISRYSGELEEAQTRIAELEEAQGRQESGEAQEVVVSMLQELRTPLTSIAGYTDLLLGETMGILGAQQHDFLQRVKANVERMNVILEQIVQLTVASAQPSSTAPIELVDLQEVIDTALNAVISQVRKKELCLNLAVAPDIPPLPANRDALCQIMIHLLSNASQASVAQGELEIGAHADIVEATGPDGRLDMERFIHLTVRDSGQGIRPEDRSQVFDPRFRADHPLIAGVGDTGVGLTVARSLVSAHGGRIWVDSQVGGGSTFSILFPLKNGTTVGNGTDPVAADGG